MIPWLPRTGTNPLSFSLHTIYELRNANPLPSRIPWNGIVSSLPINEFIFPFTSSTRTPIIPLLPSLTELANQLSSSLVLNT